MGNLLEHYGWHEWLVHSNFSFLVGASHPHELVHRACELSYRGLGLCDFDGVYGIARTYRDLRRLQSPEIFGGLPSFAESARKLKLFYGAELHLAPDHSKALVFQDTLVLLATTHKAYFHLCSLLTEAHREHKTGAFLNLESLLASPVEGLVAIQPMRGILRDPTCHQDKLLRRFQDLRNHFQGRFYLAMSRHLNPAEDVWMSRAWVLAQKLALPVLLSQDVFFHDRARKPLSDLVCAVRHNKRVDEMGAHLFPNCERALHALSYLERIYASLPFYESALKASVALAESFCFDLDELRYHYPQEMIPQGFSSQSFLEHLVWERAHQLYGEQLPSKAEQLLKKELSLVETLGFADYFLTVWDIVRWAREQKILCQGRGSAANSAICFVLGITSLDPQHFDLLFERFLSLERRDPPDIDVDFEHERREEVIQYIYKRYGRQRAAMVCNVICFKRRGALRAVNKALGEDHPQRDRYTQELRGFPRHLGIHSGGFVVTEKALNWLAPVEPATMPDRSVIPWCKEDIEGLGFFKIDILALGILTALRKSMALVREHHGHELDLASIPSDDARTYGMIQRAETVGTFQIESRAQMSFLPKHKPRNFYDLVVQIAIIRPGPIEGGMIVSYLRRRLGKEAPVIPHPLLEPILERTYGVPIFQEQVMRVAIAVGGFSPGEADELRKKIGSFTMKQDDAKLWVQKLVDGMLARGIDPRFVESLLGHIRGFASYGFPESHAASFAYLAYASCYMKCHYPEAFFAAMLNSQPLGFYAVDTLLKTARHGTQAGRDGVDVHPLCLWQSNWDSRLEEAASGSARPFAIRLGLRLVYGLSEKSAKSFLEKRKHHKTKPDLIKIVSLRCFSRKDLTALASANALAAWGLPRRSAIWLAEAAPFSDFLEDKEDEVRFLEEEEWESVQSDYRATGTSLGRHPTEILRTDDWAYPVPAHKICLGQDLDKQVSGSTVFLFGMVLVRQAPPTAKGMRFITLEDESPYRPNLVIHPQVYERYRAVIDSHSFLCVSGRLELLDGACNIIVKHCYLPEVPEAEVFSFDVLEHPDFALSRNYY